MAALPLGETALAHERRERIRDDVWNEIERLVSEAKVKGIRLDDKAIADQVAARFPGSEISLDDIRRELTRFGDALDDR